MDNLKIYQICHDLIDYFATLTSPKKSHLGPIFRTGGSTIISFSNLSLLFPKLILIMLIYNSNQERESGEKNIWLG